MEVTEQSILDMFNNNLTVDQIKKKLQENYEKQLAIVKNVEDDIKQAEKEEQEKKTKEIENKISKLAESFYNIIFEVHPNLLKEKLRDKNTVINSLTEVLSEFINNKYIAKDIVTKVDMKDIFNDITLTPEELKSIFNPWSIL